MDLDIAASPDYHISIYFIDAVPHFNVLLCEYRNDELVVGGRKQ